MTEIKLSSNNYRILKSNKLVNSRQPFTALQQRMVLVLASRVSPDDEDLKEHQFHVSEFFSGNLGGVNYASIKKSLSELLDSSIQIEIEKESGKKVWTGFSLLSKAMYDEEESLVVLNFSPDMKPFFLHLKGSYTSYFLKDVNHFQKAYTIRIYELCKQYFPQIRERKIELDELKFLLVVENKYKTWNDFKKRVILPSLKEINEYSDIFLEFEPMKRGRKISGVKFLISKNKNNKEEESVIIEKALENTEYSISINSNNSTYPSWLESKSYEKLLSKYGKDILNYAIKKIELKGEEIENPKAYLIKGLRNNWFVKESEEELHQKEKIRMEKESKQREQEAKNRKEELIQEFDQKRNERMNVWLEELSDDFIEEFILDFEDSEDSFLQGVAKRLDQGQRRELDLKKVVSWKVEEDVDSTEEDVMFAKADIKKYASNLGIDW